MNTYALEKLEEVFTNFSMTFWSQGICENNGTSNPLSETA
jgi:hypothetical protein